MRTAEVAKIVSQSWKALSENERSKWDEMARLDRIRYEREKEAYTGPWKVPNVKDPNIPKKPVSAFMAFGNERRKEVAATNPSLSGTALSSVLSVLWKECPVEIKKVYIDKEAKQREIYKQKRAEWERRVKGGSVEATMSTEMATQLEECTTVSIGSVESPPTLAQIPSDDMTDILAVFDLDFDAKIPVGTTGSMLFGLLDSQNEGCGNNTPDVPNAQSPIGLQEWPSILEPRPISVGHCNEPIGFESSHHQQQAYPRHRGDETGVSIPNENREISLESYSVSELLQADELFEEDFSPYHVQGTFV